MSIFTDVLFLFVYLIILFYLNVPSINNTNYALHKLTIFVSIFVFKYALELGKMIFRSHKRIDPFRILEKSFYFAIYGIIGYSLYVDSMYTDISCEKFKVHVDSDIKRYVVAAFIITIFILFIQASGVILGVDRYYDSNSNREHENDHGHEGDKKDGDL